MEDLGFQGILNVDTVDKAIYQIEIANPVMVFLDIHLKNNDDGVQIGNYLQQKQTIPFIYVSCFSESTSFERAKATQPQGCFYKPFELHKIKDMISKIMGLEFRV